MVNTHLHVICHVLSLRVEMSLGYIMINSLLSKLNCTILTKYNVHLTGWLF